MTDKHRKPALDRRGFLGAGLGGAAAATTAVVAGAAPAVAAVENDQQKKKARYQDSEHVKTFYRVNRY